jgi:hypothetical protein
MSERGLTMVVHSVVIGVALYAIMTLLLKQSSAVAENRSILVAACVLIYMIVYARQHQRATVTGHLDLSNMQILIAYVPCV